MALAGFRAYSWEQKWIKLNNNKKHHETPITPIQIRSNCWPPDKRLIKMPYVPDIVLNLLQPKQRQSLHQQRCQKQKQQEQDPPNHNVIQVLAEVPEEALPTTQRKIIKRPSLC